MTAAGAEVRELRAQIRHWRRGRSSTPLTEVLSDGYIAVFAVVTLGAMSISAILETRDGIAAGCTTDSCADARHWLVWAAAGAVLCLTLAASRAVGPVLVTPAAASWLLSAPVDRRTLLRRRLLATAVLGAVATAAPMAVVAVLAGFDGVTTAWTSAAGLLAGSVAVLIATAWQARGRATARTTAWVLGAVTWAGLVAIAADLAPSPVPALRLPPAVVLAAATGAIVAVGICAVAAHAALHRLRRDQLTPGGSFVASLSGALAGLDLALAYDVLVARRWRSVSTVRVTRSGPRGAWALVWRDVVRLRRSASILLVLVAAGVVPHLVVRLDLGEVIVPATALTGFVAGVGMFSALRTSTDNPGLLRCFPLSSTVIRSACLAVPSTVLVLWGVATAPAVHRALPDVDWAVAALVAIATGVAAATAAARWVMASPPSYDAPMVSSPAGAIPTGLIGSLFRGFDVVVLLTVPLLLAEPVLGSAISLALAATVLSYLLTKE